MSTPRPTWSLLVLVALAFMNGCSEGPTESPSTPKPAFATDAYCALYPYICTPSTPDPEEEAPGYYGGGQITDRYCAGLAGGINDADADVLSDDCELWLALKFAPRMIYDRNDDVRRESYWAVKPVKPGLVRVFYALGYYFDLGTTIDITQCKLITIGEVFSECDGHHGDSEWIILDLRYNATTQHWYLAGGKLSQHTGYGTLTAGSGGYPTTVKYPETPGGYPLIFVARQKHANYPSRETCNSGGAGNADDCSSNDQLFRPDVLANRNLGRYGRRLVDKVASTYPFYQDPVRYEWMWSAPKFYGWQQDHSTSALGYGEILLAQGF